MGESRQELLSWLNNLLQLNVTKVEQCGTGAALCQIYDSIFQDLPMARVKFNANTEYAYLNNFKILQNALARHGIDRPVPVESLVKCKMQDNLEFLQWSKRYWDQYYPGGDYDALARRKGAGVSAAVGGRPSVGGVGAGSGAARKPATSGARGGLAAGRSMGGVGGGSAATAALTNELETMRQTVEGLERERDFYFAKLRDIELLIQQAVDQDPEIEKDEEGLVKLIQNILYSTEEGFEIPTDEGGAVDDAETF